MSIESLKSKALRVTGVALLAATGSTALVGCRDQGLSVATKTTNVGIECAGGPYVRVVGPVIPETAQDKSTFSVDVICEAGRITAKLLPEKPSLDGQERLDAIVTIVTRDEFGRSTTADDGTLIAYASEQQTSLTSLGNLATVTLTNADKITDMSVTTHSGGTKQLPHTPLQHAG